MELAEQLLSKNTRKSFNPRNSIGTLRLSNQTNLIPTNQLSEKDYNTPKVEESADKSDLKVKMDHDRSKDSVEILREMQERKSDMDKVFKSPTFKQEEAE